MVEKSYTCVCNIAWVGKYKAKITVSNDGEGFIVVSRPQDTYKITPLSVSALDKLYRLLLESGVNRDNAYKVVKKIEKNFGLSDEWYTLWQSRSQSKMVKL